MSVRDGKIRLKGWGVAMCKEEGADGMDGIVYGGSSRVGKEVLECRRKTVIRWEI